MGIFHKRKPEDAEYYAIKDQFRKITDYYKDLSSKLKEYILKMKRFTQIATKLAEDANCVFSTASVEVKQDSIKYVQFSRALDSQIFIHFIPELENIILAEFTKFENQVDTINEIHENRKKLERAYDSAKKDKKMKPEELEQIKDNLDETTAKFIKIAGNFIQTRPQNLDAAYSDFIMTHQKFIGNLHDTMEPFEALAPANFINPEDNPFAK